MLRRIVHVRAAVPSSTTCMMAAAVLPSSSSSSSRVIARSLSLASSTSSTTSWSTQSRSRPNPTNTTIPMMTTSLITTAKRTLFIQTASTPNPRSLKFLPGRTVLEAADGTSMDFQSARQALRSPLATSLFAIEGVSGVFFGSDFVTVSARDDSVDWMVVKPHVFAAISDHFASGQPLLKPEAKAADAADKPIEEESEVVAMIRELIETRIRPSVQEDGGDIVFKGFEKGVVYLQMQGSCVGCPSSSVTLKNGIENMLMHYVPEVERVQEWVDEELEDVSDKELKRLQERLDKVQGA